MDTSPDFVRALVYCLAYDYWGQPPDWEVLHRLRHEGEPSTEGERRLIHMIEIAQLVFSLPETASVEEHTAHLQRIHERAAHLDNPQIALIMGGATKIKQYVFESAKLPEIRGASGLLDRVNLYDTPALFAKQPTWLQDLDSGHADEREKTEAEQLVTEVRAWFQERYEVEPPDCEDCIVYASGGEVLAFAPRKLAAFLTEALEHLYAQQTLSANSVAVWRPCAFAELRFGLRSGEFWLPEFSTLADDESVRGLLQDYYRRLTPDAFLKRKTFGEVTSALALERFRVREGNPSQEKAPKPPPRFETTPYARRCRSCEHRNAVIEAPLGTWLCEPCARKRAFGQKAKKEEASALQWFHKGGFDWRPLAAKAWGTRFEEWLDGHEGADLAQRYYQQVDGQHVYPADDLEDIAAAARPAGFIGVIYADGNNMGAVLEELATPVDYQAFAQAIYKTTIRATFTALATHLRPHRHDSRWRHPFEVLSIGGDDVFLIVPAHAALPIAMTIATQTEAWLSRHSQMHTAQSYQWRKVHRITPPTDWQAPAVQSRVALSSGVVIADQHTPVFLLRRMVEELLQSAKAKARQLREGGYYGATIDFIALKSFGMLATNVRTFRNTALRQGALHLTAKPYTEPELSALIAAVTTLKQVAFPKSQLYRLREQLTKGWLASTVDYLYLQARSQQAEQLRSVLNAKWIGYEQQGHTASTGVWLHRDTPSGELEWETILGDVAELYDFVPAGGETYGA